MRGPGQGPVWSPRQGWVSLPRLPRSSGSTAFAGQGHPFKIFAGTALHAPQQRVELWLQGEQARRDQDEPQRYRH